LNAEKDVLGAAKVDASDTVTLEVEVSQEWPEPEVPEDLRDVLRKSERAHRTWEDTTPGAHWDWIRWIRSTKSPETRKKRIEVARSKLEAGMRRLCCFDRNVCTETGVSNNGVRVVGETSDRPSKLTTMVRAGATKPERWRRIFQR
jgi:hypothetical protein